MAYSLLVAEVYKLLIGGGYNLSVNGVAATYPALKFWTGTKWSLVYQIQDHDGTKFNNCLVRYYDGTNWQYTSVI